VALVSNKQRRGAGALPICACWSSVWTTIPGQRAPQPSGTQALTPGPQAFAAPIWGDPTASRNVFEGSRQPEVVVMTPARYDEAAQAVRAVQQQRTVVLHLGAMPTDEAQRAIDFVSGGVCALDGQAERLADSVFLFAPTAVAIHRDPVGAAAAAGRPDPLD
jgi:cell division inhibitor SepF